MARLLAGRREATFMEPRRQAAPGFFRYRGESGLIADMLRPPSLTQLGHWAAGSMADSFALSHSPRCHKVLGFGCPGQHSFRGTNETARLHCGTWYRGYVATRGPSAATGEDEADRFRFAFGQSQRNKRER